MRDRGEPHAPLGEFLAAAPARQRGAQRLLIALASRPGGRRLLNRSALASQLAQMLTSLGDYDEPARARALGWDSERVITRGRELRRAEGRP